MDIRGFRSATLAVQQLDLSLLRGTLLPLMLRNVASDGFVMIDPTVFERGAGADPAEFLSKPGCIIASPSYHLDLQTVSQNYVFNWMRDSAIVATEIALADIPKRPADGLGPLDDYVTFAALCRSTVGQDLDNAKFTIEGQPVAGWPRQNDGPALQALALLTSYASLDGSSQQAARDLIEADVAFVLARWPDANTNLWEEVNGQSLFTRSVQLRCLTALRDNTLGLAVPPGLAEAIAGLDAAIATHWVDGAYVSVLGPTNPRPGYDPNADVIAACLYGALSCTDPKLLATASQIRRYWTDPATGYPINATDGALGIGPLIGRYPGDIYDGNVVSTDDPGATRGHPWVVCTANFAELYFRTAAAILADGVPSDPAAADFFTQAGTQAQAPAAAAAAALAAAGDQMLQSLIYHSDHLELSEQFDETTGFEKSVRNLSWSYAACLSALRAREAYLKVAR